MREKVSKAIWYILSFTCFFIGIYLLFFKGAILASMTVGIGMGLSSPFLYDLIMKKYSIEESGFYWYMLRMLLTLTGAFLALLVALPIYQLVNRNGIFQKAEMENYKSILKIVMFIIYLAVLFLNREVKRFHKYIIFGMFYLLCVNLTFFSDSINLMIVRSMNKLLFDGLGIKEFEFIIDGFLVPIKEAILTYIIFDTVLEKKQDQEQKFNKQRQTTYEVNVIDHKGELGKDYYITIR